MEELARRARDHGAIVNQLARDAAATAPPTAVEPLAELRAELLAAQEAQRAAESELQRITAARTQRESDVTKREAGVAEREACVARREIDVNKREQQPARLPADATTANDDMERRIRTTLEALTKSWKAEVPTFVIKGQVPVEGIADQFRGIMSNLLEIHVGNVAAVARALGNGVDTPLVKRLYAQADELRKTNTSLHMQVSVLQRQLQYASYPALPTQTYMYAAPPDYAPQPATFAKKLAQPAAQPAAQSAAPPAACAAPPAGSLADDSANEMTAGGSEPGSAPN